MKTQRAMLVPPCDERLGRVKDHVEAGSRMSVLSETICVRADSEEFGATAAYQKAVPDTLATCE